MSRLKYAHADTPAKIIGTTYKGDKIGPQYAAYACSRGGWEICGRVWFNGKPSSTTIAVAIRPETPKGYRTMRDAVAACKALLGEDAVHWSKLSNRRSVA